MDGPQDMELEMQEEGQVGQEASLGHAGWLQAGSGDGTSWARKTKPFVLGFHIHSLGWCPARKAQPPSQGTPRPLPLASLPLHSQCAWRVLPGTPSVWLQASCSHDQIGGT